MSGAITIGTFRGLPPPRPVVTAMSAWVLFAIAFSYALGVAGQVYLCVLYRYATKGTVPAGFTPEMLGMAWTPKKA
jgi:hypothetical protein